MFLVILYPIGFSFFISLHELYLLRPGAVRFIGLRNYTKLFNDVRFWKSLALTSYFVGISVFGQLLAGLGIALLLNEPLKGRGIVKALLVIPWALPGVIIGGIWKWIYHPDYGLINGLLRQVGLLELEGRISWLGTSQAINAIILTDIWRLAPFVGLMLLAALSTIPSQLYEASKIDGAGAWQRFLYITLPLLRPVILIVLVIRTMFAFQIFDLIFVLTRGGPGTATYTLTYLVYSKSFNQLHMGYGAAMSYAAAVVVMVFSLAYFLLLSRSKKTGI